MNAERISEKKDCGSTASIPAYISIEAYYRAEEKSLHKNEYHDGVIIPMAEAKLIHNRLAQKAASLIEFFLEEKNLDFIVSNSDTKSGLYWRRSYGYFARDRKLSGTVGAVV